MKRSISDLTTLELYARSHMLSINSNQVNKLFEEGLCIDEYKTMRVEGVVRSAKRYRWKYKNKHGVGFLDISGLVDDIILKLISPLKDRDVFSRHLSKVSEKLVHRIPDCEILEDDGDWIVSWKFFDIIFRKFDNSNKMYCLIIVTSPIHNVVPAEYKVSHKSKTVKGKKGFFSKKEALIFAKKTFRELKKILLSNGK
jgi:hypothetical protein